MNNKANQDGGAVPGISQAELDLKLKELQAADLDKAVVNVWVAVTVPANKAKRFTKIKRAVAEAECNTVIDLKLEHDAA